MRSAPWRFLTGLMALALLAACGGGGSPAQSDARLTIQAQFEKRALSPTGLSTATSLKPIRYCWAEVRDAGSNALLSSGYLGSDGTGATSVPRGLSVYVQVFAEYQVLSSDPNSFFLRGDVKNAPLPSGYVSLTDFNGFPLWSVTSATFVADRDGTLGVTALASNRIAGAFNIADQAVTFAAAVRDMDGSASLRLPNLHTFWTTSTSPADQIRSYPELTWSSSTSYLQSSSGRALFSHGVFGLEGGANTETDEWDDGVLQETFAHLLFANDTFMPDGSSSLSFLRRDNDNVHVDRAVQSESTVAFVGGFADFLAAAIRDDSRIIDSDVDPGGTGRAKVFDLTDHTYVPAGSKGEFSRGSIAISLWGLWKNVLGGGPTGLNTLWAAVRSTTPYTDGTGEYEQATLGCYPTYLQGVASRVNDTVTWNSALTELYKENIPNPDAYYFSGTNLWETRSPFFSVSGPLQTYEPAANLYYDRDQSKAWRFIHGGGARTITLAATSGQDFWLELIGPGGIVASHTSNQGPGTRTLAFTNANPLPAGIYVARVRAGRTTARGMNTYTLTVN